MNNVHKRRTKLTNRRHILTPIARKRSWWKNYDYRMRGLWCGESDHVGDILWDYFHHFHMRQNDRRNARNAERLYLRLYGIRFFQVLRWAHLGI